MDRFLVSYKIQKKLFGIFFYEVNGTILYKIDFHESFIVLEASTFCFFFLQIVGVNFYVVNLPLYCSFFKILLLKLQFTQYTQLNITGMKCF